MQHLPIRRPSSTPLAMAAFGAGALLLYALSSRRRRESLRAAGVSALAAGSRLATTSVDRLQRVLPDRAVDTLTGLASTTRKAASPATSAAAQALHDAAERAEDLMQRALARAREAAGQARRASPARGAELDVPVEPAADTAAAPPRASSARSAMLAAAGIGAGLYAMKRYGVVDRLRERLARPGADATGAIEVQKTMFIDAPVETVFDTWANYENFPRFMSNVESVQPLDGQRSHWKVKGPAGVGVEWDAVTRLHRPNEIAWESEPGSTVETRGRVTLAPEGQGTRATVRMSYRPPAGALGDAVASLFGADPKREFEEDVARMKQFIEERRAGGPASSTPGLAEQRI